MQTLQPNVLIIKIVPYVISSKNVRLDLNETHKMGDPTNHHILMDAIVDELLFELFKIQQTKILMHL